MCLLGKFCPHMCRLIAPSPLVDNADSIHPALVSDMLVNIRELGRFRVDKSMYRWRRYMSSIYLDCIVCHRHKILYPIYIAREMVWLCAFRYILGNIRQAVWFALMVDIVTPGTLFSRMSIADSNTSTSSTDLHSVSPLGHPALFARLGCNL